MRMNVANFQDYSAPHFRIARNKEQNRTMGVLAAGRLSGKSWR
jgi:hypothetical protein